MHKGSFICDRGGADRNSLQGSVVLVLVYWHLDLLWFVLLFLGTHKGYSEQLEFQIVLEKIAS